MFGHVIVKRREELGINQGQLAERLGVSAGTASKIESGQVITVDQLWKLARALEVRPSKLVEWVESAESKLTASGVKVTLRRSGSETMGESAELPALALAGLLGFLAGRK